MEPARQTLHMQYQKIGVQIVTKAEGIAKSLVDPITETGSFLKPLVTSTLLSSTDLLLVE